MSGLSSMRCYEPRNNRYDGSLYGINTWVSKPDLWSQQMKEEQIAQKPGPWFFEEDPTSCSPVSDPDDMAQFLNYRVGVQNVTQSVEVPTSEHVAEIVGRQGCKIKALRAKTNTYIKTPIRGEDPIFVVTGRPEDVQEAKREIECAADHFTQIRASRRHSQVLPGAHAPGQVTIYVRVPLRVVGLVVGPKGATIKRIQQDTHTYIITPSREREPVFEVTGLPHNVEAARKEIETHIFQRTGNLPETEHDSPGQYVGASLLQAQQQAAAQQQQSALYRKAFASSNLFNQMSTDLPFGIDSSLGLDALLRSFPSMRNSLTPDSLQGFGRTSIGGAPTMSSTQQSRPSLGGQSTKMDLPTYDYWGNNNSINDIMENEILSRNYDALSAWSSLGLDKEKREESPTNGLMSLTSGAGGFGIMQSIWTDQLNLSPGSLASASASASPASSSCDHNDLTLVPING